MFWRVGSKEAKRESKGLRLKKNFKDQRDFAGNQVRGRCASLMDVKAFGVDGGTLNLLRFGCVKSQL